MQAGWSIRRRLMAWLLLPMLAVAGVMMLEGFFAARNAADTAYDRLLLASALAISERVAVERGELIVDLPYVALDMLSSAAQDRVFYRIVGPGETVVTGYGDLPSVPAGTDLPAGDAVFFNAVYKDTDVRVAVLSRPFVFRDKTAVYRIEVAQTKGERTLLMREILGRSAIRAGILILLAGIITWFGVSNGLAPLARLQEAVARRSPSDLRPIQHDVPQEVAALVGAINTLMDRLAANIENVQRFISDAAHQLRTPLATIRGQAELALNQRDSEEVGVTLAALAKSTARTSRLADQLLSLSRISRSEADRDIHGCHDLTKLASAVTREFVPHGLNAGQDISFEGEEAVKVNGDALLLEELLRNLLENAAQHCPPESAISVSVGTNGAGKAELNVRDNGPGIPPAERENVFERFYRVAGGGAQGCGLGLAIVREIAQQHSGRVTIGDGGDGTGTAIRVELPVAA